MRIFEINDPYFAIVAAENEEDCIQFYKSVVADIEDEEFFLACMKELKTSGAILRLSSTVGEKSNEPIGIHEARSLVFSCNDGNEATLLAMDGSLI